MTTYWIAYWIVGLAITIYLLILVIGAADILFHPPASPVELLEPPLGAEAYRPAR